VVARFYLGVLVLQSGRAEDADALFEAVARTARGDAAGARAVLDAGLVAAPGDTRLRELAAALGAPR